MTRGSEGARNNATRTGTGETELSTTATRLLVHHTLRGACPRPTRAVQCVASGTQACVRAEALRRMSILASLSWRPRLPGVPALAAPRQAAPAVPAMTEESREGRRPPHYLNSTHDLEISPRNGRRWCSSYRKGVCWGAGGEGGVQRGQRVVALVVVVLVATHSQSVSQGASGRGKVSRYSVHSPLLASSPSRAGCSAWPSVRCEHRGVSAADE
ncbi:hypothetical protein O3P69_016737 [Scylla paramamosain]|uniref:Uncharacterized protein n=1 Tax=Scylla paramamosain TaxID=85552 RepID=A0AAW0SY15_SCYPA